VGSPMQKAAGRAGLIGLMLAGGLLSAGISQAQEAGADAQAERTSELVAASGGPASPAHLVAFSSDKAAVDVRDDDVAADPAGPVPADPAAARTPATPVSYERSGARFEAQQQVARATPSGSPSR
jgi:hypothetical protein